APLLQPVAPVSLRDRYAPAPSPPPAPSTTQDLVGLAREAALRARDFAYRIRKPDGHWCAELESNTTVTAEYVFMNQALGLDLGSKRDGLVHYFFRQQKTDGSWGLATNHRGDVSTTAETYLALRILGVSVDDPRMQEAERYVLMHG